MEYKLKCHGLKRSPSKCKERDNINKVTFDSDLSVHTVVNSIGANSTLTDGSFLTNKSKEFHKQNLFTNNYTLGLPQGNHLTKGHGSFNKKLVDNSNATAQPFFKRIFTRMWRNNKTVLPHSGDHKKKQPVKKKKLGFEKNLEKHCWCDDDLRRLICIFRNFGNLYIPQSNYYGDAEVDNMTYNNIALSFPGCKGCHVREEMERMIDTFRREHEIIEAEKLNNNAIITPNFRFYEDLLFLKPYIELSLGDANSSLPIKTLAVENNEDKKPLVFMVSSAVTQQQPPERNLSGTAELPPTLCECQNDLHYDNTETCQCETYHNQLPYLNAEIQPQPPMICCCDCATSMSFTNLAYAEYSNTKKLSNSGCNTLVTICSMVSTQNIQVSSQRKSNDEGSCECDCENVKASDNSAKPAVAFTKNQPDVNTCDCSCEDGMSNDTDVNSTTASHKSQAYLNDNESDCEDIKSNDTISKSVTTSPNVAQMNMLCDMIRVELEDAPDFIFYDAKWRIIDVLRDVHKRQLVHQKSMPIACVSLVLPPPPPPPPSPPCNQLLTLFTNRNRNINCPFCLNK